MSPAPDPDTVSRLLAAVRAYETEGMAAWIDVLHPEVEWEVAADLANPGQAEGPDDVLGSIEGWEDAWGEIRYRTGEISGDGPRAVIEMNATLVGRSSGITVENKTYWATEWKDGLVVRGGIYPDRASAEARLGL